MRISDWSSDVCSSDLRQDTPQAKDQAGETESIGGCPSLFRSSSGPHASQLGSGHHKPALLGTRNRPVEEARPADRREQVHCAGPVPEMGAEGGLSAEAGGGGRLAV